MKISRQSRTLKQRLQRCDPRLVEAILTVSRAVAQHPANPFGRPPRAFLVGGLVRDLALGQFAGRDADMEIYGVQPEILEAMFRPLFPNAKISTVGKAFGIIKLMLEDGISLDLALPRTESKEGEGHRGFRIIGDPNLDPEMAARRRDFTMNAMSLDPLSGTLLDPLHGLFDLEEGVLRIADAQTFGDDPLRALRAVQLVGRFGLRAEEQTLNVLRAMVVTEEFRTLSLERVTDEWKKLFLKAPQPSRGLQFAQDIGLTDFPVVLATDTCAHLAEREQLSADQRLVAMLAVLFEHQEEESRKEILEKYLFGSEIEHQIGHVIHGLKELLSVQPTANKLRQFIRNLLPVPLNTFFVAAIASGKLRPIRAQSWLTLIQENNLDEAARSSLLRGQDLIELGLPMGPRIGEWIAYIEHLRDEGTLETREQALHTVTELLPLCPSPPQIMPSKNTSES